MARQVCAIDLQASRQVRSGVAVRFIITPGRCLPMPRQYPPQFADIQPTLAMPLPLATWPSLKYPEHIMSLEESGKPVHGQAS